MLVTFSPAYGTKHPKDLERLLHGEGHGVDYSAQVEMKPPRGTCEQWRPVDSAQVEMKPEGPYGGWRCGEREGPEVGEAGEQAADSCVLSLGYALLLPDGSIQVDVPGE